MIERRFLWLAVLGMSFAGMSPACKTSDAPLPIGSVRKLGGAPARVYKLGFAADGKSVLALERRSSEPGDWSSDDKYAITRRPVTGGEATEVHVSERELVDFAPLGDGMVVLERRRLPASLPALPGESERRQDFWAMPLTERELAIKETALVLIAPGQPSVRFSPEAVRCFNVVGAAGGKWVAFSVSDGRGRPEEAIVHVRSAKPDEQHTLSRTGIVYDISPDGARVLILRRFSQNASLRATSGARFAIAADLPPLTVFDLTAVSMVEVKANNTLPLPGSLQIDGAELPTDKLAVRFATDGLIFHSEKGDVYRSALDGSKAARVAGARPEANGAAPVPAGGAIRVFDGRGAVLDLYEDGAAVEVSKPYVDSTHPKVVSAGLEGPLAALGPVALDATGTRMAFAVLSDTSRDGVFDVVDDDATVFVSDPAKGSLALGRTQTPLLADELRLKVAAALAIPPPSVTIVHAGKKLEATAELPWIEGEKAQALVDRMLIAATALDGAVPQERALLSLRVGPFETRLRRQKEGGSGPYVVLDAGAVSFPDPAALPLVLRDSVLTTDSGGDYERTLTGTIENTGTAPTGPGEVVVTSEPDLPRYPDDPASKPREVKVTVGVIEPGQRAPFKVKVWPAEHVRGFNVSYLAGGKPMTLLNGDARADGMDWLDTALAVRAEHGAWIESDFKPEPDLLVLRVRLSDSQVALAEGARAEVMERTQKSLSNHFHRFHRDYLLRIQLMAPGGGGWLLGENLKPLRFEPKTDLDSPRWQCRSSRCRPL